MSNIKFNTQLFLDNLELNRFKKFIFDDGFENAVLQNTKSWGIVKNDTLDPNFNYFRISQGSPISGNVTFQMSSGYAYAYDLSSRKIKGINNKFTDPIPFPQDGNWYWIKISPIYRSFESGKVSIDSSGNLIGVNTKFTEILRGQPDFPARIKFYSLQSDQLTYNPSSLNSLEYDVLEVVDDNNVILQGTFNAETNLYYTVVGTFTPGYIVPGGNKEIFQYDDCLIEIIQENLIAVNPTKPVYTQNLEFFIYRIKYDSGNLIIQDYRNEIFKMEGEFDAEFIENKENPLIGIESVIYDDINTPREFNKVKVAWGFRSTAYNVNSNLNKIGIVSGNGGVFKSAADFSSAQFNNWRLYILDKVRNGDTNDAYSNTEKYYLINSSVKNGTGIDLFLDRLDSQDFIPAIWNSSNSYNQNDKVTVGNNFYRLIATSSINQNPGSATWSGATTYSIGQVISYNNKVYVSLQNTNLNHQPDTSVTFWSVVWETFIPEILLVPDVEEVEITVEIGRNVLITEGDPLSLNKVFTFPVNIDLAVLDVVALNDLVLTKPTYIFKYNYKTNKVFSDKFVFPSDVVGYTHEGNGTIPYSSDYFNGFIKIIKAPNAFSTFKARVDLGDAVGVTIINNLEAVIAPLSLRTYPLVVGTNKQQLEITGDLSVPLTGDVKIDLSTTGAKTGNRFFIYFNTKINNAQNISSNGFNILLTQDGTSTIYTFSQDEINKGQQYFILTFDSALGYWDVVHFDKDYNGNCVFKEASEVAVLSSSPGGNIEVIGGKNYLVVSGYYEYLVLENPVANSTFAIDGIRFLNGKFINNLKIRNSPIVANALIQFNQFSTVTSPPAGMKLFAVDERAVSGATNVLLDAVIKPYQLVEFALLSSSNNVYLRNANNYTNGKPFFSRTVTTDTLGAGTSILFDTTADVYALFDISILVRLGHNFGTGTIDLDLQCYVNGVQRFDLFDTYVDSYLNLPAATNDWYITLKMRFLDYLQPGDTVEFRLINGQPVIYSLSPITTLMVKFPY